MPTVRETACGVPCRSHARHFFGNREVAIRKNKGHRRRLRIRWGAGPAILAAVCVAQLCAPRCCFAAPLGPLTTIQQVRGLPPEEAERGLPVHLRGTVLLLSGWKNSFFFSDGSVAVSIDRNDTLPEVQSGDEVEVFGKTSAGRFAPIIVSDRVQTIGRARMPPAPMRSYSEMEGGGEDSQWVRVRGVVQAAWIAPSWGRTVLFLEIDLGGAQITARVHDFAVADPSYLVDTEVSVQGVCGTNFNHRRQFVGLRLFVADMNSIVVEKAAPVHPFDQSPQDLDSLQRFSISSGPQHRIHVSGTVTYQRMGTALYLQHNNQGLYVETTQPTAVTLGSKVDALGFVSDGSYSPHLHAAIFRVTGPGEKLIPISVPASHMIGTDSDGFLTSLYDGLLVRMRGKLVYGFPGENEDVLIMSDGPQSFRVLSPRPAGSGAAPGLRIGSELDLTGVISTQSDENREPSGFQLWLRSPADIAVVHAASWWDQRHSVYALVTFIALASWAFVVVLRHKIRQQVDVIRLGEERFRGLVETSPNAILLVDLEGKIVLVNAQAEKMFGFSREELLGQKAEMLAPMRFRERPQYGDVFSAYPEERAGERGTERAPELCGLRKDGSEFPIQVGMSPLETESGTLMSSFIVDITERKRTHDEIQRLNAELEMRVAHRTAQLSESNEELEAFNYTAAHDLRAPLRHMIGFVNLLRKDWYNKLDDDGRHCLDVVASSSKTMGALLDDLLNFSRLGRIELKRDLVSLDEIVSRIRQVLVPDLQGRNVTWDISDLPEVMGDSSMLHQALFNLMSNAVKYTSKCDDTRIKIGSETASDNRVTVFVRDNGAGFEPEYGDKLFRVFQRLHSAREYEGTGMGLAIVRRVVERHGGEVWAEGAPGRGATFYISLPTKGQNHEQSGLHTPGR
jgi:PAS domain S-box-containing protein